VYRIRHCGEERDGERDTCELKKDGGKKIQRNQETDCEQQGVSSHREFFLLSMPTEVFGFCGGPAPLRQC
jgi:hypothetical protein